MSLRILGLGTALPAAAATQEQALDLAMRLSGRADGGRRGLLALYRRAGVSRRSTILDPEDGAPLRPAGAGVAPPGTAERMRAYERHAPVLAALAAARALEDSALPRGRIAHLVTVSCTGAWAPGLDVELLRRLELAPETERLHVGFMGCHGALAGLRAARALGAAQPGSGVLLCAVELCSLHFHYGDDPQQLVANALFADGAAALVGVDDGPGARPDDGDGIDEASGAPGARAASRAWRAAASGSCLLPRSEDAMSWSLGDQGFRMTLSPRVPEIIGEHLRPWLEGWLAAQGLALGGVRSWALHPGGPRVLDAVQGALGLADAHVAPSRELLAAQGNMSSPTVLFLVQRLRAEDAPRPCVALAFGPGLVVEAALFR